MIVEKGKDMEQMETQEIGELDEEKGRLILALFQKLVEDCNDSPVPNGIILSILLKISSIIALQKGISKEDLLKMTAINFDITKEFGAKPDDAQVH